MELKPALNYKQQINKLKNDHNLLISDEKFAKRMYIDNLDQKKVQP